MRRHNHLHYLVTNFDGWWWYPRRREWLNNPNQGKCSDTRYFATMRQAERCVRHLLQLGIQDVYLVRLERTRESRAMNCWQSTEWPCLPSKEMHRRCKLN
jgi:hypothetical protein